MKSFALCMCIGLIGCGSGNNGLMQHEPDMTARPIADMSMPDLAQATCGAIVSCAIMSGATNPLGALQCFQGASPMGQQQAGALILCAAQHCLSGDGGVSAGNQLGLLQCLTANCQMQLSNCQGLPF